ncbi:N2,N2-dimethylguanosine tRNA methyltransferase [Aphanomyces astaci]|uniref:tRNA (guanine(26)-N(2))-dimethyltransferase n=1 Tax=Aphanomyces astaci TaxID=112090 RepID=W4GHT9_APHAT|nr:N2,N2-dimethylguanosine tRNA methyltransferase [Aphanomyces astaci]ETV79280.1 N2,N2-dimethylguanosine tRNA methyltransferase [Aphanomyces astaci]|eukprot:XP_009831121.1 N2,N2-dimethylguanosine tRNA methyltransferase [Aphanomyces astaci]
MPGSSTPPVPPEYDEGRAKVTVASNVFFSQHQELQRDMTVLLLQHLQAKAASPSTHLRILDALSGCGIRAIRYALEVPRVVYVVANDVDADAVASIEANVLHNHVIHVVQTSHMDAVDCMWKAARTTKFDVIDLDPFGACASLLASAIATVSSGGLICATDTDMHTLLGKTSHAHATCHAQYGAVPVTAAYGKELAIRIILGAAASLAAAHHRVIEPVLCTAVEFYVRLHFRVHNVPPNAPEPASLAIVHQCIRCAYFRLRPLGHTNSNDGSCDNDNGDSVACPVCGSSLQIGGPLWTGPLQDKDAIASIITTETCASTAQPSPATSLLRSIHRELMDSTDDDLVLFISMPKLFRPFKAILKATPSKQTFQTALETLGYATTTTHLDPMGIKTNANMMVVYSVVVTWLHAHGCANTAPILPKPNVHFAPPVKCTVDHTWQRPDARSTGSNDVIGQTFHVSAVDALTATLALARPHDCVILHGHRYVLTSPLLIPSHVTLQGRMSSGDDSRPETTLVGQVVVRAASHVTLRHLHVQYPAAPSHIVTPTTTDAQPLSKRPARVHPVLITSSSHVQLDRCRVSCARRAAVLACVGIVDGSASITLMRSTIHAGPQAGVCVAGCGVDVQSGSSCHVVGTRVADCGKSGLFVHSFGSVRVEQCHMDRNGMAGVEVTTHGTAWLVRNVLSRGKKGGMLVHSGGRVDLADANVVTRNALAGVDVRGVGSMAVLRRNHVCNGRASGVFVSDDGHVELHRNVLVGHKRAGIETNGDGDAVVYTRQGHAEAKNEISGNGIPVLGATRDVMQAGMPMEGMDD